MASETINLMAIIKKKEGIVSSTLEDEVVMLDIEQGKYFGLDPVGARIWEIIETPHTVKDIITTLTAEYDVTEDQCKTDVLDFLTQMQSLNMIDYA